MAGGLLCPPVFDLNEAEKSPRSLRSLKKGKNMKNGLCDLYSSYFRVGAILNGFTVRDAGITDMFLREYNSVTCENEMKPEATMVREGSSDDNIVVSLARADRILRFCEENRIPMRGHTLVWHGQTPRWFFTEDMTDDGVFTTPEKMERRMESYIKNIFAAVKEGYPKLTLYAYDVCNECIADDPEQTKLGGARRPGYGKGLSPWVEIFGDNSFIEKAFIYAKKYAPEGCSLFYNDYNEFWDHKRDCIYELCRDLYGKGLLDGVGMQSHIRAELDGFTGVANYTAAMKKYASIGCQIQITELDISTDKGKHTEDEQVEKYKAVFSAAMNVNCEGPGKVTAICLWGANDRHTWIGADNSPLLFDAENNPKKAYFGLKNQIDFSL